MSENKLLIYQKTDNYLKNIVQKLGDRNKSPQKLTRDSLLFKVILDAILTKGGERVTSLDLTNIEESVTDFYFVCDVQTNIEMRAIAHHVEQQVKDICKERPLSIEESEEWVLVDYVNVVVHIFKPEDRTFYDIESLWMDSDKVLHN